MQAGQCGNQIGAKVRQRGKDPMFVSLSLSFSLSLGWDGIGLWIGTVTGGGNGDANCKEEIKTEGIKKGNEEIRTTKSRIGEVKRENPEKYRYQWHKHPFWVSSL